MHREYFQPALKGGRATELLMLDRQQELKVNKNNSSVEKSRNLVNSISVGFEDGGHPKKFW